VFLAFAPGLWVILFFLTEGFLPVSFLEVISEILVFPFDPVFPVLFFHYPLVASATELLIFGSFRFPY